MHSEEFKDHVRSSPDPCATIQANCHHRVTYRNASQTDVMHQVNAGLVRSALGVGEGEPLTVKANPMATKRTHK
ncbi:hypothetical protein C9446_20825 (plasmid) [Providencia heimbachae]|nr:hypothetical protein C9446_20825 [Providencia heimbachae]